MPKGQCDHTTLQHDDTIPKTKADKAQLFPESVERHFGTGRDNFDLNHLN